MPAPPTPTAISSHHSASTNVNYLVITTSTAVAVGESIIVAAKRLANGAFVTRVVDSAGNVYETQTVSNAYMGTGVAISTARAPLAAGATITVYFNGASTHSREGIAFKTATAVAIDKQKTFSDITNNPAWSTGNTAATIYNNEYVLTVACANGANTSTPGGSDVEIYDGGGIVVQGRSVTSTGVQSASGTWTSAPRWCGVILTLRDASVGTREILGSPVTGIASRNNNDGGTSVFTLGSAIPAGATGILMLGNALLGCSSNYVQDSQGNIWSRIVHHGHGSVGVSAAAYCRYLPAGLASGQTITVAWDNATAKQVNGWLSYVTGRAEVDETKTAVSSSAGTSWSTGTSGAVSADDEVAMAFAFAGTNASSNSNMTGSSPAFTERQDAAGFQRNAVLADATNIDSGATITAAGTWAASQSWAAEVVSLNGVLDGIEVSSPRLMVVG